MKDRLKNQGKPQRKSKTSILAEELEEKNKKIDECLNQLKRIQADFDNYCKWSEKQREEHTKYANQRLLTKILDIVDSIDLALESAKNTTDGKLIIEGVGKISKQLHSILQSEGVTPINPMNQVFDPEKHEAVSKKISEEHPEDTVLEEVQKGYMMGSKVLRHAKVVVSTKNSREVL